MSHALGQYEIIEKIAQGGMAQVFKAKTHDSHGIERFVVIKRILPHISADPEYVDMLINEAKTAVHFNHGNIAQIFDLARLNEDYFIVMEYVDGKTLSQINKRLIQLGREFPLDILIYCLIELCIGLSYIHNKRGMDGARLGVVHRDVSPQNVILSYSGNIKIIDFGVAKIKDSLDKTASGVLKGKFAYMSPEQTWGNTVDKRSDIFSVGILMWELVTGKRLFKKATNQETIQAIQKCKFEMPSSARRDVPREYDKIVKKALEKTPKNRYADAGDLVHDLEKLLFKINPRFKPIQAIAFLQDIFSSDVPHKNLEQKENPVSDNKTHETKNTDVKTLIKDDEMTADEKSDVTVKDFYKVQAEKRWYQSKILWCFLALLLIVGQYFAYDYFKKEYLLAKITAEGLQEGDMAWLNGEQITKADFPIWLEPTDKKNTFDALREDYLPFKKKFDLKKGQKEHIVIEWKAEPPLGALAIDSVPQGAKVFVDDRDFMCVTPCQASALSANQTHRVRVEREGYETGSIFSFVPAKSVAPVKLTLKQKKIELKLDTIPTGLEIYEGTQLLGKSPLVLTGDKNQSKIILVKRPDKADAGYQIDFGTEEGQSLVITVEEPVTSTKP